MKLTIPVILALAIYLLLFVNEIPCPIKYLFGISCPGCGMTRATVSALFGDIAMAFTYHPMWIILPPSLIIFILLYIYEMNKQLEVFFIAFASALIITYIIRIIMGSDVLAFDIQSGIIPKFFISLFT